MKRRILRGLGITLAVVLALLVVAWWQLGRLVLFVMTPSAPFDPSRAPPAPDYQRPECWSALPDRADVGDAAPDGSPAADPARAPADVFYIHPTSYLGPLWNSPVPSPELDAATDRVATHIQATAFNACCAVYAPRYRQTNGLPFVRPSADGDRALDLAYQDVRRAFDAFNARRGAQRPFIIASHSQGTAMAERLLYEAVSRTPLRERLAAAYLIGGSLTERRLREMAPDLPPCASPTDVRCVVAFNARSPSYRPSEWDMVARHPGPRLCTNPLTWRLDGAHAPASANLGAVFLETPDRSLRPAFADARCADGTLRVTVQHRIPRDAMSTLLDRVLGDGNLHPVEFQLFFANLRANAVERVRALATAR